MIFVFIIEIASMLLIGRLNPDNVFIETTVVWICVFVLLLLGLSFFLSLLLLLFYFVYFFFNYQIMFIKSVIRSNELINLIQMMVSCDAFIKIYKCILR